MWQAPRPIDALITNCNMPLNLIFTVSVSKFDKNYHRNEFLMPNSVGKVVLHIILGLLVKHPF